MILFALVCFFCIVYSTKKQDKLLNPVTIFVAVWFLSTLLASMRLSKWHTGIDEKTILTLSLVVLTFTVVFFIFSRVLTRKKNILEFGSCPTINKKLKKALITTWAIVSVIEVIYSGGFPLLWHIFDSGKTYFDFGIPSLHGLMNSVGLVIILICLYDALKKEQDKLINFTVIGLLIGYYVLLLTRQVIISAFLEMAVVVFVVRKRKWSIIKLIIVLIVSIVAFGLLGNIRTGYEEFMYVAQMRHDIPEPLVGFYWVYMYLSMTVANLNKLITGPIDYIGFNAFSSVVPSVLASILNMDTGFYSADYLVTPAFNVSGFFVNAYLGFGLAGAIIHSALYGIVSAFASVRMTNSDNESNVLIYAVVLQIVALSFFDDMLLYLPCSFQIIILLALSYASLKLTNREGE